MSSWAYVNGGVAVSCPGSTQKDVDVRMQQVVSTLPAVFGSEGNATWFINKDSNSYNSVSYRNGVRQCVNNAFTLCIKGNLRDTTVDKAYKEMQHCLQMLAQNVMVYYCSIDVCDCYDVKQIYQPYSPWFDHNSLFGKYYIFNH